MKEKWKSKRLLSILLMLCMVLTMVPITGVTASAADDTYGYDSIMDWGGFRSCLGSIISRDLTLENDIDYTMGYDDEEIRIDRSQKLDLNGHKIRIDATKRAGFLQPDHNSPRRIHAVRQPGRRRDRS